MPALDRFSPVARGWFESAFQSPTPAQEQGWEAVSRGEHTLILAPTGSGKTLAAFLWALDRLVSAGPPPANALNRCRVLYVSPLKALTYDVERNLRAPLAGMAIEAERLGLPAPAITVATRTGDTSPAERRDLSRRPPDILVTTPESLYLMLTSAARSVLAAVEYVIIDEIHSVAATKRGAHLALSLERLERLVTAPRGGSTTTDPAPTNRHPPQRIGLSATQRPLDEVARFLGGRWRGAAGAGRAEAWQARPVAVVDAGVRKPLELQIVVPVEDMGELGKAMPDPVSSPGGGPGPVDPEVRHSIWPAIHPVLLDLIRAHTSTLVFVNSRRLAERLAARLNELAAEQNQAAGAHDRGEGTGPAGRGSTGDETRAAWPAAAGAHDRGEGTGPAGRGSTGDETRAAWPAAAGAHDRGEGTGPAGRGSTGDETRAAWPAAAGAHDRGEGTELVRAHHGSIAREQRLEIEDALKAGKIPALVATSSLELGIDMGAIDLVVQVESPPSVASGLQRIGRAGHQVGQASRGRIFPKFRGDLLTAAVVVQRMKAGLIEETRVPRNPLDVLAQQIVAMCVAEPEPLTVDDVAEMVAGAYPFADCSRAALEGVLDMLAGRYPSDEFSGLRPRIVWDRVEGTLRARAGARMLAVVSGGTIPDRGLYGVFTPEGNRVGELDEEYVYESRVGETFVLGASTWRIEDITHDRVVVMPAPGQPGKMPFWHGDSLGRPVELGRAIGAFLREIDQGAWGDERLAEECALDPLAVRNLKAYIEEEKSATGGVLPTDRQVVVERFRDELGDWRVCVLSPFGAKLHAPWALAIEAKVRDRMGLEVQTMWSDDGIVVRLPEAEDAPPVEMVPLEPEEVEELVVGEVATSALFASRFRENAARSLLLPRRRPGSRTPLWQQRQRASDLLAVASRHGEFPVLLETYRECLADVFDLPALIDLMGEIRSRTVRVASVDTASPSPFASSLAFAYVANFLYDGDAPLAERRAQALTLDRAMLADLLGAEELRELIDVRALEALEANLQYLDEPRWARDPDEAHDMLRRLGDLSVAELAARSTTDFSGRLIADRRAVDVRVAGEPRLIAAEDAGRYRDALGVQPPAGLADVFLEASTDPVGSLLGRWARTHGPFTTSEPASRFGLPEAVVRSLLTARESQGLLLQGEFRPGGHGPEWCDPDVLRGLRQRSLAVLRREVEPVEAVTLARFLPAWQGVGSPGRGIERLVEVVRQLQGVAIPASVLERDVLSCRVADWSPRLLDELLAAGEVVWTGAGALGRDDGKVMLFLRNQAAALRPERAPGGATDPPASPEHDRIREVLARRGACFFRELAGSSDRESLEALWDLVWAGEVTNDSFAPLRAFVGGAGRGRGGSASAAAHRRPRPGSLTVLGPPKAQGRWTLVDEDVGAGAGAVTPTQRAHARAAALLDRHGVLTREAARGEGHPGGFAGIYPVLRAMEESGRCRRGYFVAGLGGAQFALPGAVDRLRSISSRSGVTSAAYDEPKRHQNEEDTLVLAATDPANPYGVSVPWPERAESRAAAGPRRVAGAYVVLVDGIASLYVERGGKSLVALRDLGGRWEGEAVAALGRLVTGGRLRRLSVERFDDALGPALRAAGFVPSPKGLVLYGR